jgi:hypothetical protein
VWCGIDRPMKISYLCGARCENLRSQAHTSSPRREMTSKAGPGVTNDTVFSDTTPGACFRGPYCDDGRPCIEKRRLTRPRSFGACTNSRRCEASDGICFTHADCLHSCPVDRRRICNCPGLFIRCTLRRTRLLKTSVRLPVVDVVYQPAMELLHIIVCPAPQAIIVHSL